MLTMLLWHVNSVTIVTVTCDLHRISSDGIINIYVYFCAVDVNCILYKNNVFSKKNFETENYMAPTPRQPHRTHGHHVGIINPLTHSMQQKTS